MGFITLSDGRKVMMKQNHYPDSDKKEFWQDLPKDERERLLNKTHISPQDAKELSKKHWKTVSNSHANSGASNVQGFVNYVRSVYNKQDFQREKYEHANRHMKNQSGWGGDGTVTPELQKKVLDEMFEQRKYRNRRH